MVLSRCMPVCPDFTTVIARSHIYVPAAYRSCIYENFDTPRSEAYFVQATYIPRTSYVTATFTWRVSDVSVFVWNLYGVSRRMCYVRVLYVWRMKCTRDESTAYVLRSILICGVSVLYQMFLARLHEVHRAIVVTSVVRVYVYVRVTLSVKVF